MYIGKSCEANIFVRKMLPRHLLPQKSNDSSLRTDKSSGDAERPVHVFWHRDIFICDQLNGWTVTGRSSKQVMVAKMSCASGNYGD